MVFFFMFKGIYLDFFLSKLVKDHPLVVDMHVVDGDVGREVEHELLADELVRPDQNPGKILGKALDLSIDNFRQCYRNFDVVEDGKDPAEVHVDVVDDVLHQDGFGLVVAEYDLAEEDVQRHYE